MGCNVASREVECSDVDVSVMAECTPCMSDAFAAHTGVEEYDSYVVHALYTLYAILPVSVSMASEKECEEWYTPDSVGGGPESIAWSVKSVVVIRALTSSCNKHNASDASCEYTY